MRQSGFDISLSRIMSAENGDGVDSGIQSSLEVLYRAADSKSEDPDSVVASILNLEKLMREKNKIDPELKDATLEALAGAGTEKRNWRLVFTTGTVDTQKKTGQVNYFPIKAIQSFCKEAGGGVDTGTIENGIYLGRWPVVKFAGDFDWTSPSASVAKLTFDFSSITLFGSWTIPLKVGEAAAMGAKSGLGSRGNVELEKRGKRPFFNWISADERIATARGGGGGLALWRLEIENDT